MGRRGEPQIFNWERKVRGEPLLCRGSPPPAQPFLCPLFTLRFPLEPLRRAGTPAWAGEGGPLLPQPRSRGCAGAHRHRHRCSRARRGRCRFALRWLLPLLGAEVGGRGRPPHGLGRARGGGRPGSAERVAVHTWSLEGVCVRTRVRDPMRGRRWDGAQPCGQGRRVHACPALHPAPWEEGELAGTP